MFLGKVSAGDIKQMIDGRSQNETKSIDNKISH